MSGLLASIKEVWHTLFTRHTLLQVAQADRDETALNLYKALGRQEDVLSTVTHLQARLHRLDAFIAQEQSSSLNNLPY